MLVLGFFFRQDQFPVSTSASARTGALGGGERAEGLCCS